MESGDDRCESLVDERMPPPTIAGGSEVPSQGKLHARFLGAPCSGWCKSCQNNLSTYIDISIRCDFFIFHLYQKWTKGVPSHHSHLSVWLAHWPSCSVLHLCVHLRRPRQFSRIRRNRFRHADLIRSDGADYESAPRLRCAHSVPILLYDSHFRRWPEPIRRTGWKREMWYNAVRSEAG